MALWGEADSLANAPKFETLSYTIDASSASVVSTANDTITISDHGFVNGDRVNYRDGGGTAIVGLTDEAEYFVVSRTDDTFKLSATSGGSAIDLTGVGVGTSHVVQRAPAEVVFVDRTEAGVAANRAKGIKTAGWNHYEEYGSGRRKVEPLVAMSKTAASAGDLGTSGGGDDSDVADS